jgi:hypothetical protein
MIKCENGWGIEEENVMPAKTCAELEKLTFAGLFGCEKEQRALVRQLLGERKLCEPRNGGSNWQKIGRSSWVAGTEHTLLLKSTAREADE